MRQCNSDYVAEDPEALLIKKPKPSLNTQLYANGLSLLPNVL